ncbi:MAG: cytochrome c oxidase subunit 3 [Phycisphaerales bacterium]|nr:cytochrome c oxidase subunit 3 [Phycisphaerales bacterium]
MQQQFEAGKLGMWLFLATEVLLFAGLFCAYTVYRFNNPEVFKFASQFLNTTWGAINTMVLLASSFTAAMAVRAAQLRNRQQLVAMLAATILGACGFLVIKYIEYSHKISLGINWGKQFHYYEHTTQELPADSKVDIVTRPPTVSVEAMEQALGAGSRTSLAAPARSPQGLTQAALSGHLNPSEHLRPHEKSHDKDDSGYAEAEHGAAAAHGEPTHGTASPAGGEHGDTPAPVDPEKVKNLHLYFSVYYCLTGLHGIHVLAGIVALTWVLIGALKGRFDENYFTPVDLVGLYWHLVDLIWIYLFPWSTWFGFSCSRCCT